MSERRIDVPEPGYYATKLVKGGVRVPARIVRRASQPDRSPVLICMVAGEEKPVMEWWPRLHPVDEATYNQLVDGMPDDVRKPVDFLTDPVAITVAPRNSRDSELTVAADIVLAGVGKDGNVSGSFAADVVTLVKQIIAERDRLEEALAKKSEPLKAELKRLKDEHFCEADVHRPKLLAWLAKWTDANGGEPPRSQGCTAFWSTTTKLVADDRAKTPREFMIPDEKAIKAALAAGRKVRGWRLEMRKEMRVA